MVVDVVHAAKVSSLFSLIMGILQRFLKKFSNFDGFFLSITSLLVINSHKLNMELAGNLIALIKILFSDFKMASKY